MEDIGSLAVFKGTARDQGHYKGPSGAFLTYCNISCFIAIIAESKRGHYFAKLDPTEKKRVRLYFVLMLHVTFQGSTQIGFQDTIGTLFS